MSSAPAFDREPQTRTRAEALARDQEAHEARIGRTFNHWRVEASEGRHGSVLLYRCVCVECGALEVFGATELLAGAVCFSCLAGAPEGLDGPSARALARLAAVPRLDPSVPWAKDADARAWVAECGASTLEECGRAYGLSAQRVAQIEKQALAKLRAMVRGKGYGPEDVDAAHAQSGDYRLRYG